MHCYRNHDHEIDRLLHRYRLLELVRIEAGAEIPGSYWGAPEAGLVGTRLYVRPDTPVHSLLHEAAHFVCMDARRRADLDTDAGGDDAEEDAVCYLQVILGDQLAGFSRAQLFDDMDAWGYSFRLGSTAAWFRRDSDDARRWLLGRGLIGADGSPTWQLRE